MARYVVVRLVQSLVLMWLVTVVMFVLVRLAPGGPAILADPSLSRAAAEGLERTLGLDRPIHLQYLDWLGSVVRGDLGISFIHRQPVTELIAERLPNSVLLGLAALFLSVIVGIPLGVLTAVRRDTWVDYLGSVVTLFNLSIPAFWFGIMLIVVFAVQLRWLPAGGMQSIGEAGALDTARHLILPSIVASGFMLARIARYVRASVIETLREDYVRTARAKGIPEWQVYFGHALRNALIPVVTVIGLTVPQLFAGAAITETVFGWPGMGQLGVEAAANGDYPLILGITMAVAVLVIGANLITDLSYSSIDPRVRLGEGVS